MSPTTKPLPELSAEARVEAKGWLDAHRGEVPASVADALSLSFSLAEKMAADAVSRRNLVTQLHRAFGIIPSSERRASGKPLAGLPKDKPKGRMSKRERLIYGLGRAKRLSKWYRGLARRHGRTEKDIEGKIVALEDTKLTPEDDAEIAQEEREYDERLNLGQRCDLDCAASAETLMTGASAQVKAETVECRVDRDGLPRDAVVKQEFVEERERISFSFTVTRLDIQVEKLAVATKSGMTLVAGSLDEIGPPKSKVTWEFLASMSVLVAQYAMPLNRFAGLVSTPIKRFTAAEISRHFRYTAGRLAGVYLQLGKDLANSPILVGDDTTSRVLEITKTLALQEAGDLTPPPWEEYATAAKAQKALEDGAKPTLALKFAAALGFESDRKDGTGAKTGFNTTVLSGRLDPYDPRTTIVFFRSHLGGLGNLLTAILQGRREDNLDLVLQTDLSTVNLISDPALRARLNINLAGCSYHARRPFAIHEGDDPELCAWILHAFKGVAIFEGGLDAFGRNRDNSVAVRGADARAAWEQIKEVASLIAKKWSGKSGLGEGARYILKHFPRLTYYLDDHRLAPSNNFSERMLRLEKLIENNALFRQTLEGRFALDVVRTVLQTAIAAKVDLQLYLMWILAMPPEVVASSPAEFTPHAFARLYSNTIKQN